VPGLDVPKSYGAPAAELGPADVRKSLAPNAPVVLLRVDEDATGKVIGATRHLAWAEPDANADILVQSGEDNGNVVITRQPPGAPVALLIRSAVNFTEGKRYVAVLRNLKDGTGAPIRAATAFRVCRDRLPTLLPPIQQRCEALEQKVFPALKKAGIARDESLYLAWDFTVASTNNQVGRLRAMRDEAFAALAPPLVPTDCTLHVDGNGCTAPGFTVDTVLEGGDVEGGILRQIQGTITVPSFVVPVDPSPLEDPAVQQGMNQIQSQFPEEFAALFEVGGIGQGATAPPNRLFYDPTDAVNPSDPQGGLYGDGLPDSIGTMTTRYMCQIPEVALVRGPAKAGIYGHGLLDSRVAITYDGVDDISREHDTCSVPSTGSASRPAISRTWRPR
jgi:hypothetical protein